MDKNTLLAYQPDYYKTSKVMEQTNTANASELTILNNRVNTEYNNMYPDTADSNTLSRFEKDNGLTILPNYESSYRRSRLYSRMIGKNDFSVNIIKNIANLYGSINTIVDLDLSNFKFIINMNFNDGIPININDFEDTIEEIKPPYFEVKHNFISNKVYKLSSYIGATIVNAKNYKLSNNLNENIALDVNIKQAISIPVNTFKYELS